MSRTPFGDARDINVAIDPSKLSFTGSASPCGPPPLVPKTEYWEKQIIVRLHQSAVTKTGFSPAGLRVLEMLQSQGPFTVETVMSCWEVSHSISTGKAEWRVSFGQPSVEKPAEVFNNPLLVGWISAAEVGDGKWVGPDRNTVNAAGGAVLRYKLDLSSIGSAGKFSLYWAADNNATWSIVNGKIAAGSDIGGGSNDFHFSKPSGAPRHVFGTFGADASLIVDVRNQAGGSSPCGLLVSGTAGAYPDLTKPDAPRLKLQMPQATGQQPKIGLDRPGSTAVGPFLSEHAQESLRCLLVNFENEPNLDLLRCLRSAPGVKYVDRIPVVALGPRNLQEEPILAAGPASPGISGMQLMSFANKEPDPQQQKPNVTVEPEAYRTTIGRVDQDYTDPTNANLAVIDDAFGSIRTDHGLGVWNVACQCLYGKTPVKGGPLQFAVKDLRKSAYSPSRYFDALRNIADGPNGLPRVRVVNISRGSSDWTRLEYELLAKLEKLQVVVVAAAGQGATSWMVDYPASFPDVLSVGSLDTTVSPPVQYPTMNSNYNMDNLRCLDTKDSDCALDVVGPARNIRLGQDQVNKYRDSGNSFAAPMVAALCSQIAAKFPDLSAADIRKAVRESCGPPRLEETRADLSQQDMNLPEPYRKIRFGRGLFNWSTAMKRASDLDEQRKKG